MTKHVKAKFREKARMWHPIAKETTEGKARFVELFGAYQVLKNFKRMKYYDRLISASKSVEGASNEKLKSEKRVLNRAANGRKLGEEFSQKDFSQLERKWFWEDAFGRVIDLLEGLAQFSL